MHSLWGGVTFILLEPQRKNALLPPLQVNHAMDYSSYCASEISHRPMDALVRLVGSRLQKPLNFIKKQTPGRKDSEKFNTFQWAFFTHGGAIYSQICTLINIKKVISATEDNNYYSSIPLIIILTFLFIFFSTIIAMWMNGTELFLPPCSLSPTSQGSNSVFCGEA